MDIIDPIPIDHQHIMRYDPQWHALICLKCKIPSGVGRHNLHRHFNEIDRLKANDYKPILDALDTSGLPILQSLDRFPRPPNNSIPIEGLPIQNGVKCKPCGYLSTSAKVMKMHITDETREVLEGGENASRRGAFIHPGSEPASLQTWSKSGWKGGYWTVVDPNATAAAANVQSSNIPPPPPLTWKE